MLVHDKEIVREETLRVGDRSNTSGIKGDWVPGVEDEGNEKASWKKWMCAIRNRFQMHARSKIQISLVAS